MKSKWQLFDGICRFFCTDLRSFCAKEKFLASAAPLTRQKLHSTVLYQWAGQFRVSRNFQLNCRAQGLMKNSITVNTRRPLLRTELKMID